MQTSNENALVCWQAFWIWIGYYGSDVDSGVFVTTIYKNSKFPVIIVFDNIDIT